MAATIELGIGKYLDAFATNNATYGRGTPYTQYTIDLDTCFQTLRTTINIMIGEIKAVQGPNATLGQDVMIFNDYVAHISPVRDGFIGLHSYLYTNNGTDIDIARGDFLIAGQKVTLSATVKLTPSVLTNPQYVALDANGYPILATASGTEMVDIYELAIAAGPTITGVTRLQDIFFDGDEYENMRDRPAAGTTPVTFSAINYDQFNHRMRAVELLLAGQTSDDQSNAIGQPAIRTGTAGAPGLVIVGCDDTGIYGTTTSFSIATEGVNRVTISSAGIVLTVPFKPSAGIVLESDDSTNGAIKFGAGQDASIYYDNDELRVTTDLVAASDFVVDCGPEKTLRLEEVVWDDLRVSLVTGQPAGASSPPGWVKFKDDGGGSAGVYAWAFDDTSEEQLFFAVQLPHRWKEGTDIEAHIHWTPDSSGAAGQFAQWGLEYTWQNVDGTFGNTTIITSDASAAGTATTSGDGTLTADKHYISEIGTITGSGKTISSMLICRVFRDATDGDDDLPGDAFAFELDFHHQIDTMGSRQEYVK